MGRVRPHSSGWSLEGGWHLLVESVCWFVGAGTDAGKCFLGIKAGELKGHGGVNGLAWELGTGSTFPLMNEVISASYHYLPCSSRLSFPIHQMDPIT